MIIRNISLNVDFPVIHMLKERGADDALLEKYDAANPAFMSVSGLVRYWKKEHERQLPGHSDV